MASNDGDDSGSTSDRRSGARHSWRWSVGSPEEDPETSFANANSHTSNGTNNSGSSNRSSFRHTLDHGSIAVAEEVDEDSLVAAAVRDARQRRTRPRSFEMQSPGLRSSLGFDAWKRESLAAALTRAGVNVPPKAPKSELVKLARQNFSTAQRSLPTDSMGNKVRYTSQQSGVKYVQGGLATNTERPSSVPRQAELYYPDPAIAVSTDGSMVRPPPSNFRTMRSVSEDEFAVDLDEMVHELDAEDLAEENERDLQETLENRMKLEFQKPSLARAKAYMDLHHPRNREGKPYSYFGTHTGRHCPDLGRIGNLLFCGTGPESELARYGAGISLYFKWLKWLSCMFLFLSIIVTPQLYINMASYEDSLDSFVGCFQSTMLSSLANADLNSTLVVADEQLSNVGLNVLTPFMDCDESCAVNRKNLGYLYMGTNMVAVGIFAIGVFYLTIFETREGYTISRTTLTVDEYTVQVVKTPPDTTETELKRYFTEVTGEPVHEVIVAHNSGKLISLYMKRGRIIHKLWKAASKVYHIRDKFSNAEAEAMEAAVIEHRRIVEDDLNLGSRSSLRHSVGRSVGTASLPVSPVRRSESVESYGVHSIEPEDLLSFVRVRKAFVKRVEKLGLIEGELRRVVSKYDKLYAEYEDLNEELRHVDAGDRAVTAFITFETQVGYLRCLDLMSDRRMAREQPLFHEKTLRVRPAPPPSTIIWENYDYGYWDRFRRRLFTTLVGFCILIISIVATNAFATVREVVKEELTDTECVLPGNVTSLSEFADLVFSGDFTSESVYESWLTAFLECACGLSTFSEVASATLDPSDECYEFWKNKAPLFGYTFMLSIIIAATNFFIRFQMSMFVNFEKHHSLIPMQISLSRRIFLTLVFNTGLVIFLVNEDWSLIGLGFINRLSGLDGYTDFTTTWYADVGLQVIFIMLINTFAPQLFVLIGYLSTVLITRNRRCHKASSQRELNEWFTGPTFLLHYRIAQNLMTVFVTFLYGPGIPILYPIAMIAFAVYYWTDKFFLLRFYRIPPRYDGRIWTNFASSTLLFAIIPNLAFAIWMYSTPGMFWFPSDDDTEDTGWFGNAVNFIFRTSSDDDSFRSEISYRMTLPFIIPLVGTLVIYVGCLILVHISTRFRKFTVAALNIMSCGFVNKNQVTRVNLHPPISYAKRRGIVSGLTSYSILRNPVYANAFGIDEHFANEHSNVASMKNLNSNQLPTLPRI